MHRISNSIDPHFKTAFSPSLLFALVLSTQGNVREMTLCSEVCGYAQDIIGNPFWEAGWWRDFPDVRQRTRRAVEKVRQDAVIQDEVPFLDREGQTRWGSRILAPIKDEAGNIVHISVVGLDITDKKQRETALAESEEKYKNLVNNIPGTAFRFVLTAQGIFRFDFVGENCSTFFGYTAEELLQDPDLVFSCIPQPDRDKVYGAIGDSAKTLAPYKLEHRIMRKDGTAVWGFTSSIPHLQENGDIIWDGIVLDISDRKEDQAMLARTEKFTQIILESAPILFLIHQDGIIKYINAFGCSLLGGSDPADFLGISIFEFVDPEDRKFILSRIHRIGEGHSNPPEDIGVICRDGRRIWVESSSLPLCYDDAHCTLLMSIDITERKLSEQALARAEKKWRNILINTPQIGISLDTKGSITFVNEYFLKLTGWKKEDVLGRDWFDTFIPGKIKKKIRTVFLTTIGLNNIEGMSTFENEIMTKTGEVKDIAWSNVITKDAKGHIKDVTCLGIDLTERILAENALKESEAKYRSMMEAMDEAAYICSPDFKIEYMNPAMAKKIGRNATGEICHMAIHNRQGQCSWCQHANIMRGQTIKTELLIDSSGETYFISHSPIYHTDGSVSKLSIYRDVTEIKKLEARLQQSQKMESIGTLAGGIAHDFNNILFPIMGQAEILIEDLPRDSQESESAHEIFRAGKRGSELVKQILSFSRQSDKKKMPVQIQRVLKEVLTLSRATIPSDIKITDRIQQNCGKILGDPTQLHQVLMNLITNAYHAVETTSGSIHVELAETPEGPFENTANDYGVNRHVRLMVSDTGVGIAPDMTDRIFDPYFTTKEKGKGTGLGLATVYGIVKEFDGEIRVESEPGKGTAFKLYFPVLKQTAEDGPETDFASIPGGDERILVVDDEEPIAMLEKRILQRSGYQVARRTSSIDALEKFKADPHKFDLILTDMAMPNMTGSQLAAEIMAIRPDIPIIICTGFSDRMNRQKAERIGIKGFLKKPIITAKLLQMVRELMDSNN